MPFFGRASRQDGSGRARDSFSSARLGGSVEHRNQTGNRHGKSTLKSEFAAKYASTKGKILVQSRQQQGTPRMTNPNQVAFIVGEPNGAPLERAVPATELENFIYMGRVGEIELCKPRITRRYLNIGRNSQTFYQYLGNGEYAEFSHAAALEYVRRMNRQR
jgi:hypothetical protein